MTGYLDALTAKPAPIIIGGGALNVERARLGLHLRLSRIADDAHAALCGDQPARAAELIRAYLVEAGLGELLDRATGPEMFVAFTLLCALNAPLFVLPFMLERAREQRAPAYDYEGRGFALWIHKLATRYGWTRHYIFDELYPEEVACYLQEILVAEYDEEDRARVLSEMAYERDKASKMLHFRPLPRPAWMIGPKGGPRTMRVNRAYVPMGEIINLSRIGPDDIGKVFAS